MPLPRLRLAPRQLLRRWHVWDEGGAYLGTWNRNGCCGYQWRTLAKPDDYWSQHARDTAQDADASESNGGDS